MMPENADIEIIDDGELEPDQRTGWKVLIVDDDPEVHSVTRLALSGFEYEDKPLQLISAYSAREAIDRVKEHDDLALILLDVVMETDHAGLEVVSYIRDEMKNMEVSIVLRTGQPGQAPPKQVVTKYHINDYRAKAELTNDRMHTVVYTGIRMYNQLHQLAEREAQLARSNRDLEQFAYIASHDLQEPLRTVRGFAELLYKDYLHALDGRAQEYVDFIGQGVRKLENMIQSLLQLSRLNGKPPVPTLIQVNDLINHVRRELSASIEASAARIEYSGVDSIVMDEPRALILLRNLISNSIKFRAENRPPQINIEIQQVGQAWQLVVRDNGIGFEQEYASQIFNIFARLHTYDVYEGTGIGLALCKKIVEESGGRIEAESGTDQGAQFTVYLPLVKPEQGV